MSIPTGQQRFMPNQPGYQEGKVPRASAAGQESSRRRPPLARNNAEAWVSGVASGIARHLDWPVWLARMGFIGLTITGFLGVGLYGALWVLMPKESQERSAPGLEAASHQNMRQTTTVKTESNLGRIAAVSMLVLGVMMLVQWLGFGISASLFGPALLAGIGIALVWVQADVADDEEEDRRDIPVWLRPVLARKGIGAIARIILGVVLIGLAMALFTTAQVGSDQLVWVLWVGGLSIIGIGIVVAPWILRYKRKLDQAKEEKLIADTRADMAAHLHDSVLQTLALIQLQADDARQVASLARQQERELRSWLYDQPHTPDTLKAALEQAGGEIDQERGVPIEVICVGDLNMTENLWALVQAAREAMMNAAKHSQADSIDVYAEVEDTEEGKLVQVFIRDRGKGFQLSAIGEDRMGVKGSIIERMQRHGGSAQIRTAPGEGTEIRLEMMA